MGSVVAPTVRFGHHDADPHPIVQLAERVDAAGVAADPPLRLSGHLDLGDEVAGRRIRSGERDAGCLADHAATAIASDEVRRPERRAVRQPDVDAGVVPVEAGHLASAQDRHGQLTDPAGQDALDVALPEREPVVVPGRKVADVQARPGEPRDLGLLALRDEAIGDPALVEDLDRARVQPARARADEVLARASLDDDHVDPRQGQLARQHQPRRAAAGDHHRVLGHRHTPVRARPSRVRAGRSVAADTP